MHMISSSFQEHKKSGVTDVVCFRDPTDPYIAPYIELITRACEECQVTLKFNDVREDQQVIWMTIC